MCAAFSSNDPAEVKTVTVRRMNNPECAINCLVATISMLQQWFSTWGSRTQPVHKEIFMGTSTQGRSQRKTDRGTESRM